MTAENIDPKSQHKAPQAHMPPGMVMGPDGKPCKICTAFRYWKPPATRRTNSDKGPNATDGSLPRQNSTTAQQNPIASMMAGLAVGTAASSASTSTNNTRDVTASPYRGDEPPPGCPPDVEQLGRATWTFLHTTAAYYPEKPTPTQRANMLMLLRSLPVLYPCTWCADDFGKDINQHPPDVSGRIALSRWLCERHNEVNEKLGKERFNCANIDERWKDGPPDRSCD